MGMDIRVLGFERKLNRRTGKEEDWVTYAPAHAVLSSQTTDKVKHLVPPESDITEDGRELPGTKMMHMKAVWSFIEPRYKAWLEGAELPETGIALANWPAIGEPEIFEFNKVGVKSVEDVAGMTESAMSKVALPNARRLRDEARHFLEAMDKNQAAERIADLESKLAALMAEKEAKPKRGRPPRADKEDAA